MIRAKGQVPVHSGRRLPSKLYAGSSPGVTADECEKTCRLSPFPNSQPRRSLLSPVRHFFLRCSDGETRQLLARDGSNEFAASYFLSTRVKGGGGHV